MDAYFDLANFVSYVMSHHDEAFSECNRLIRKNFNLKFSFSKEDMDNLPSEKREAVKRWISAYFSQGFKGERQFSVNFPKRPLTQNFYQGTNRDRLSSIYLLDDSRISHIKKNGILLVGCVGDEISTISKLMVYDYECYKTLNAKKLLKWDDIKDFIAPCTDIILCDQFILNRDNSHSENLYKILQVLSANAKQIGINVVIFVTKKHFDDSFRDVIIDKRKHIKDYIEAIMGDIRETIKEVVKIEPRVTVVLLPHDLREHDRTIFTNYRFIISDPGFSIFNNGKKTRGRWVHINSLAKEDVFEQYVDLIDDLQEDVDEIKKRNNPDLIIGDKVSNYLTF